jgi:hypothetical protein
MIAGSAFASLKLAGCSDSEFTLFVGLVVKADDKGRGEGDPLALKMQFPNRNWTVGKIKGMMDTVTSAGLVFWYYCPCGVWYEVVDWSEYQQGSWMGVHQKPSRIPDLSQKTCCKCGGTLVTVSGDTPKISKVKISKDKINGLFDDDFEEWWKSYPRKVAKSQALACYTQLRSDGVPAEVLIDALAAYVDELRENDTEMKYIKHASTFLGPAKHYEDYAVMKGWEAK